MAKSGFLCASIFGAQGLREKTHILLLRGQQFIFFRFDQHRFGNNVLVNNCANLSLALSSYPLLS